MKEKIGMEKLVMLLDIYEEEVVGVHSVGEHITGKDEAWIISKKFGFIKWLVENDKIDLENEELISLMSELGERRNPVKCLLMLLSIQDEPINFLISILK